MFILQVTAKGYSFKSKKMMLYEDYTEVRLWCNEQFGKHDRHGVWSIFDSRRGLFTVFRFKEFSHAMAFRLRWC